MTTPLLGKSAVPTKWQQSRSGLATLLLAARLDPVAEIASTLKKWLADPLMPLCPQAPVEPLLCSRHRLGATGAKTSSAVTHREGHTTALGGLVKYCHLEEGGISERTPGPKDYHLPRSPVTTTFSTPVF